MNKQTLSRFRTEIRHFFLVSLLNLVFAAIAIAIRGVSISLPPFSDRP